MKNDGRFKKGIVPWNKGKKGVMPVPWNKGKKAPKISEGMLGKKHSEERIQNQKILFSKLYKKGKLGHNLIPFKKGNVPHNLGKSMPQSVKDTISKANLGKPMHPNTRKVLSKFWGARKGAKLNLEQRKRISEAHIGIPSSRKGKPSPKTSGENNSNWKGGITPENVKIRSSIDYIDWRTKVFKRDDFTCQECGERGGNIVAHHIWSFANYPEKRFEIDNGITVCQDCHTHTHQAYQRVHGVI